MTFFHPHKPVFCSKPNVYEVPEKPGQVSLHWQIGNTPLVSTFYTLFDQITLIWSIISIIIFFTAQFFPISWHTQAIWWSGLTVFGTVAMIALTPSWLKKKGQGWVVYSWILLMLFGLILTDLGIFLGWGVILMYLAHLWLGLVGICYLLTGLGMKSRALLLTAMIHWVSIFTLPYFCGWEFLITGVVMGGSGLILAQFLWDSHALYES